MKISPEQLSEAVAELLRTYPDARVINAVAVGFERYVETLNPKHIEHELARRAASRLADAAAQSTRDVLNVDTSGT
jgi:hypothetical protein